jgi:hypothetical protein
MGTDEQKAFAEIMEHFDFEKCAKAMRAIGWVWHGNTWSPTVGELKNLAREHFDRLQANPETLSTYSGGLRLARETCDDMHQLVLEFVLAGWESEVRPV